MAEKINKSQLIRDQLAKTPDASPTEVAERLGKGFDAAYVSTIKSNEKRKAEKKGRKPSKNTKLLATAEQIALAIKFVKEVGGIEQAKAALDTIERIKQL